MGKEHRRVNIVQMHMYKNGKLRTVETIPGMEGGGKKKYGRGSEFK
jgi:hypothetical protein